MVSLGSTYHETTSGSVRKLGDVSGAFDAVRRSSLVAGPLEVKPVVFSCAIDNEPSGSVSKASHGDVGHVTTLRLQPDSRQSIGAVAKHVLCDGRSGTP